MTTVQPKQSQQAKRTKGQQAPAQQAPAESPEDRQATLESLSAQLTALAAQVASLTDLTASLTDTVSGELRRAAEAREPVAELVEDLTPIASDVMAMATRELEDLDLSTEDLTEMLRELAGSLPVLRALLAQLQPLSELASELTRLSGPAMESLTQRLAVLDSKGYFSFAEGALGVTDRVVTSFTREDVDALGENVVTILGAVREMTQPEIMGMLQRTAVTMQVGEDVHTEPPTLRALFKQVRDPDTRRGLGRALAMLHTMGEEHPVRPAQGRPH